MIHEKNWRVSLCVQELCHPERRSRNYTGAYFKNTGVAQRMNFMIDFREFQHVESICNGKISHVPSQPTVVPSLCGMLSRGQSLGSAAWNLLGTSGVDSTPHTSLFLMQ